MPSRQTLRDGLNGSTRWGTYEAPIVLRVGLNRLEVREHLERSFDAGLRNRQIQDEQAELFGVRMLLGTIETKRQAHDRA